MLEILLAKLLLGKNLFLDWLSNIPGVEEILFELRPKKKKKKADKKEKLKKRLHLYRVQNAAKIHNENREKTKKAKGFFAVKVTSGEGINQDITSKAGAVVKKSVAAVKNQTMKKETKKKLDQLRKKTHAGRLRAQQMKERSSAFGR